MMRNNMTLRRLKGVTRTIRLTILDPSGNAVDLTQATAVRVVVSRDGFGSNGTITPGFTIGGDGNNVVTFVWRADQQNASGAGRYTITIFAYYNDGNVAKYNWHGPDGIELVEFSCDESGTLPDNLDEEANVEISGTFNMNGVGQSAYECWLSLGNEGSEADFINSLKGTPGGQGPQGEHGISGGMLFPTFDFDSATGILTISGLAQEVSRISYNEQTGQLIIRLNR